MAYQDTPHRQRHKSRGMTPAEREDMWEFIGWAVNGVVNVAFWLAVIFTGWMLLHGLITAVRENCLEHPVVCQSKVDAYNRAN